MYMYFLKFKIFVKKDNYRPFAINIQNVFGNLIVETEVRWKQMFMNREFAFVYKHLFCKS